jgi:hypothetical protein
VILAIRKGARVYAATAEFECDKPDCILPEKLGGTIQYIHLVTFHVDFQKVDVRDSMAPAVVVEGINADGFPFRERDPEVVQPTFG